MKKKLIISLVLIVFVSLFSLGQEQVIGFGTIKEFKVDFDKDTVIVDGWEHESLKMWDAVKINSYKTIFNKNFSIALNSKTKTEQGKELQELWNNAKGKDGKKLPSWTKIQDEDGNMRSYVSQYLDLGLNKQWLKYLFFGNEESSGMAHENLMISNTIQLQVNSNKIIEYAFGDGKIDDITKIIIVFGDAFINKSHDDYMQIAVHKAINDLQESDDIDLRLIGITFDSLRTEIPLVDTLKK